MGHLGPPVYSQIPSMATTLQAPPSNWPPSLWSMLPMTTTVPLWPPVYAQPPMATSILLASMANPSMATTIPLTTILPWPPPYGHHHLPMATTAL